MSQEIIYTSAPQGLKPGSRGFCTVVSTTGMAKNLAQRLESLSGYRHLYMAHDPKASQNPVNYSHLVVTVGGRKYHVLSRIGDAGLDYTQRSNKLAHHVALEASELTAANPAWVLSDPAFAVDSWDGKVQLIPAGRQPRQEAMPARPCSHWQQATGDAAWAGVLAENASSRQPTWVIYPEHTPVLEMIAEALRLLPAEQRWRVSFSTYFTRLPAGVDCQWRCVPDASQEAKTLRRDPRAQVLDLCKTLGTPPENPFVEAARTGRERAEPRVAPQQQSVDELISEPETVPVAETNRASGESRLPDLPELDSPSLDDNSQAATTQPRQEERPAAPIYIDSESPFQAVRASRRKSLTTMVAAGIAFLFVATVAAWMWWGPDDRALEPVAQSEPERPSQSGEKNQPAISTPETTYDPSEFLNPELEQTSTTVVKEATPVVEPVIEPVVEQRRPAAETPVDLGDPFAGMDQRRRRLMLPPTRINNGSSLNARQVALTELPLADAGALSVQLSGELSKGLTLEPGSQATEGPSWSVSVATESLITRTRVVAEFQHRDQQLWFRWIADPARYNCRLDLCFLRLQVGEQSRLCHLVRPDAADPLLVNPLKKDHRANFASDEVLPDQSTLTIDLALANMPPHKLTTRRGMQQMRPGDDVVLSFSGNSGAKISLILAVDRFGVEASAFSPDWVIDRKSQQVVPAEDRFRVSQAELQRRREEFVSTIGSVDNELEALEDRKKPLAVALEKSSELITELTVKIEALDATDPNHRLRMRMRNAKKHRQELLGNLKQLDGMSLEKQKFRSRLQETVDWSDQTLELLKEIGAGQIHFTVYFEDSQERERLILVSSEGGA